MSIYLVTGPPNSGKTAAAIGKVLEHEPIRWSQNVRYIVPTVDAARQLEDRLMDSAGVSGILGNVITTFYSLAREYITRDGFSSQLISDIQKSVMLEQLVTDAELDYFRRAAEYPGFVDALGEIIGEMKLSLVTPDDLDAAIEAAQSKLADHSLKKLSELAMLYRSYQRDILERNGLHDREGLMGRALETLRTEGYLRELKCIVFDSFEAMQPVQREFLKLAAEQVPEVLVTLTYEPGRLEVFEPVAQVREFVLSLGAEERSLDPPQAESSITQLSRNIFAASPERAGPDETLKVLEGGNPSIEIELVADGIRSLVLDDGFSLSDIAIVARSSDRYSDRLERTLRERDIAVETANHPLIETAYARLLVACIDCVSSNWSRIQLFHLLKSDLLGSDLAKACRAEVDAKQLGILEGRENWLRAWGEKDGSHVFREQILEPIAAFQDLLGEADGTENGVRAVRQLMSRFELRVGDDTFLARDAAAARAMEDILQDMQASEHLLGRPLSQSEFLEILRGAVSRETYTLPRSSRPAVRLLSPGRLAGRKFRAVFVVGLLEKVFPLQVREESFVRDAERRTLSDYMPHRLEERLPGQAMERFHFYSAVASATERLCLSYPLADEGEKGSLPSFYLDEVKKVFDGKPEIIRRDITDMVPKVEDARSRIALDRAVVYALSQQPEDAAAGAIATYNAYPEDGFGLFASVFSDCWDKDALITGEKLLEYFSRDGGSYKCTELEAYAACPFLHFCQNSLGLEPVREEVGALDAGTLLHEVLYRLFSRLTTEAGEALQVRDLDPDQVVAKAWLILDEEFEKSSRYLHLPRSESELQKHVMKAYLKRYLIGEITKGWEGFSPSHFELEFGSPARPGMARDPESMEAPLVMEDGSGLSFSIRGKMDRVDVKGEQSIVIDYKLAPSLASFKKGLTFQFLVYALALKKLFGKDVCGAEYRPLKKWNPCGYYVDSCGIPGKSKVFPREGFEGLLQECEEIVLGIVRDVRSGRIAVEPLDCKKWCSFRGVCRTDDYKQLLFLASRDTEPTGVEVEE